jgi:hypothetical protein
VAVGSAFLDPADQRADKVSDEVLDKGTHEASLSTRRLTRKQGNLAGKDVGAPAKKKNYCWAWESA